MGDGRAYLALSQEISSFRIVNQQAGLDECCRAWREAGVFAFDTEFIRDDTYDAILCLVQVAAGGEVVLVDPTGELDLTGFWGLVADPGIITIVHAGKEDFELCLTATGSPPRRVFDVQTAAGFLGYGYPLSLSRLVSELTGGHLTKAQTLTDWLRRPLTEAQTRYAVEDVVHLPAMYARLTAELKQAGRAEWAEEEFRRFEEPELYQRPPRERLFRLKGTGRLDSLGLLVLERLLEWRDRWAQERNRPVRAMIRDDVLVEIARRRPRQASDLQVLRGFPQARNPKIVAALLELIEQARNTPRSEWPKVKAVPDELPMTRAMLDVLSAVLGATCHEQRVSQDLVGSTGRLRELLDFGAGRLAEPPALLRGWREKFIGRQLLGLLKGDSELRVSGWPNDPRVQVETHLPAGSN